jgi:hypothetical protein
VCFNIVCPCPVSELAAILYGILGSPLCLVSRFETFDVQWL